MKYYTEEHEWLTVTQDESVWRMGITDFAQEQLGDIVHIDLPEVGAKVNKNDSCAVVESVKSASDVNSPLEGEVIAVNASVVDDPSKVNESAEEEGWLLEIKVEAAPDTSGFMDAEAYAKKFGEGT